jgi:hypothetical protein
MKHLLYQPNVFWEDRDGKAREAASKYFRAQDIELQEFNQFKNNDLDFTLLRGSLDLARRCGRKFDFARADKWLPAFREHCINSDAYFTDLEHAGEIIRKEGAKFLRSVSPFKDLAGDVFDYERYKTERAYQSSMNISPRELIVVVAEPVHIVEEYRFIFVNNKLVGESQYMSSGELDVQPYVPDAAREIAQQVGGSDYFCNIWDAVIDIGRVGDEYKLVEINGFETSSFYAADCGAIYKAWAESLEIGVD